MNNSSKLLGGLSRWIKKSLADEKSGSQRQRIEDAASDGVEKKAQWLAGLGSPAKVVGIERETPNAVTLTIARDDGENFEYQAGQFITLYLFLGSTLYRRSYSISSVPESGNSETAHTISITVKEIFEGRISQFLNRDCEIGQELIVAEPTGDFTLDGLEQALESNGLKSLVYVAAGSGIAPIYALLKEQLVQSNAQLAALPTRLLYSARREDELIFHEKLQQLTSDNPHFLPQYWVTRDKESRYHQSDRLQPESLLEGLKEDGIDLLKTQFYLCGPSDFTSNLKRQLLRLGIAESAVAMEAFVAAASIKALPFEPQPITIRNVGMFGADKTFVTEPGETVWQAARRNKIKIPTSCRVGGCRTCVVKLGRGQVVMDEPNCLTAVELQEGKVLSCVAYPLEPLVIDRDVKD